MERNELARGAGATAIADAREHLAPERHDSPRFARRGKPAPTPAGAREAADWHSRDVLLQALVECDPDLGEHALDVATLAEATASRLGLDHERQRQVRLAAELHDVGKLAVPDRILEKPRALSTAERLVVERHAVVGERILAAAPGLRGVARIVRLSHEWVDGTGYPDRLTGSEIPLESRVIGACDAYDAMVSDRPYRRAMTPEAAIAELRSSAGSQFDREVVEVLCGLVAAAEQLAR